MTKFTSPLNDLKIASPCEESWEAMLGNERKRYCGRCQLNVYNLSGMSKAEAEQLVAEAEGRLCVRFYQRADGSVITQDCPVGWAKIKNRTKVLATAAFSLILSLFSGLMFASYFGKPKEFGKKLPSVFSTPERTMGELVVSENTNRKPVEKEYQLMGAVAPPPAKSEKPKKPSGPIKEETKRKVIDAND